MVVYHKSNVVKVDPLIRLNFVKDNIGIEIIKRSYRKFEFKFSEQKFFQTISYEKGGGAYARDVFLRFSQGVLLKLGFT